MPDRRYGYAAVVTSQEDQHDAGQPPVDPARALDELEERVLGRTTDPDPADRDEERADGADTETDADADAGAGAGADTETDPVEGDSGTGIDQEPTG
ncbi:hypothetical protein GCM10009613_27150 [Pseudonocardia kongjuensis]|uniref:Uncharacterized protein n=1 Tax=Pseudonocardia kongjuensis TaxID=102227 RepID=A0ABN1XSQ7_9PSEU